MPLALGGLELRGLAVGGLAVGGLTPGGVAFGRVIARNVILFRSQRTVENRVVIGSYFSVLAILK